MLGVFSLLYLHPQDKACLHSDLPRSPIPQNTLRYVPLGKLQILQRLERLTGEQWFDVETTLSAIHKGNIKCPIIVCADICDSSLYSSPLIL
jgi:hypothetical protein